MKQKTKTKIIVAFAMIVLLLLGMAYYLTGGETHEWTGAIMFALFILHHILNISWYKNLFRGKYTATRAAQTAINLMLHACVIGLMISGLILSRHVFSALPIPGSRALGRELHHISAYWGFVLMSAHLGLHAKMIMGMLRKAAGKGLGRPGHIALRTAALLISTYGVYAFIKHNVGFYMFNLMEYAFFDYDQPAALFFMEYLAIVALCACTAYYLIRLIDFGRKKKEVPNENNQAE